MAVPPQTRSALAHVRRLLRTGSYSERTEKTYLAWIERFLGYHRHPKLGDLGRDHASAFLGSLAAAGLAAKTRNQAASALSFFYRYLLDSDAMSHVMRARGRPRLPTVLSHDEARAVLRELRGRVLLVASLLYGTGLRLNEALSLRVKDLDFDLRRITVREGKGGSDRVVMMPVSLEPDLRAQLRRVRQIHAEDRALGGGWAPLPGAMHRKRPHDGFDLAWQFLFPAARRTVDSKTEHRGRGPSHPSQFQRAVKLAVRRAGITKPATCHTFRHSFATQLLRDGYDVRIVQELLGHKDLRTTMVYLHVADGIGIAVRSPLDRDEPGRRR